MQCSARDKSIKIIYIIIKKKDVIRKKNSHSIPNLKDVQNETADFPVVLNPPEHEMQ